ncbi:hypothetical protein ACFSTH_04140 [Paenibacillus yanchengensis]|uniref:Uncharacterized protein n=1 Tax=Paenibacillus yanchengensis TaxID=2035833 RepID=A0ABW4YJV6_9BACL
MMNQLKGKVILVTTIITAIVLFGGWAIYEQFVVKAPLEQAIMKVDGIIKADKPVRDQKTMSIQVELSPTANLKEVYTAISEQGKRMIGNRTLQLDVNNQEYERLDQVWEKSMFQIAEAMETRTYSTIPNVLEQLASDEIEVYTEMDDSNVYITLKDQNTALHKILPRVAEKLGVWTNV